MAGVLSFTLGLETSNFLRNLGVASGGVLSLAAVGNGVQAAFTRLWGAVQQGGNLKDLADAASVSVGTLYQLRRGFEEVGGSADSVGSVLQRLRSNLAGGQQDNVLASLGLDPESLRRADPVAQMEQITAAMSRLDATSRARVGMNLFGREGAQVATQIANSGNDFADAMARAAEDATTWQLVSTAFDAIADKANEIEAHFETMWAKLAGALIQAFNEGQLSATLFDIFNTTFDAIGAALPDMLIGGLVKIGEILLRVLQVPLTYMQTAMDVLVQEKMQQIAMIPGLRDVLGVPKDFKAQTFDEAFKENQETGLNFFGANFEDMSKFAGEKMGEGWVKAQEKFAGLGERLGALVGRLPQSGDLAEMAGGEGIEEAGREGKANKANFNELEKMGFVFGNAGAVDYGRDTATNTRKTNELLARIETKLGTSSASFANA